MDASESERYSAQLGIPCIGEAGQRTLAKSSVLVAGAGGLGSVLLYCLCAAGVGHIGIADGDTVSLSNLNRQILYTESDIGTKKVLAAEKRLAALNSRTRLTVHDAYIIDENVCSLIRGHDIVISAVDNNAARRAINRACCYSRTPLISGGVDGMCGTVTTVLPGETSCLECMGLPDEPAKKPTSFAPTVSTVSAMMAQATLLLLLKEKLPFAGDTVWYDGSALTTEHIRIARRADCPACGSV